MRAYFYVEARMVDGIVSFKHAPVSARNDDDAYTQGKFMLDALRKMGHPDNGHSSGPFLNDYVIEVPGA